MKQTAVEWLIEQLQSNSDIRWRGTNINELGQQAKAMEKEQIIDAYCEKMGMMHDEKWAEMIKEQAEEYYNETFKSE